VVLGHDFTVVLSLRGGKGVAATTGILLSLFPLPTLIGIITFVLVVVLTRMVSLGSLIFVTGMAAYTLISGQPSALAVAVVGIAVFAILRHRSNIQRILNGTENLVSF
jgi:glycerol-3-phosphate acyltransferase PlsY